VIWTDSYVSSLRDFAVLTCFALRRLKPAVNKVLSLRDIQSNLKNFLQRHKNNQFFFTLALKIPPFGGIAEKVEGLSLSRHNI
jgi:hypothetical protein